MKSFYKLLLIFILVVSISSCNTNSEIEEKPTETPTETPGIILEDEINVIDIYRPPTPNINTYLHYEDWTETMKDIYDIEINVHLISPLYQSNIRMGNYYQDAIRDGKVKGIIEIKQWEIQSLINLKNEGLILPLDEYLKNNAVYQALPEAMKKAYVMPDNQTWAIVTSSPFGLYSRKLRKEWVDNLGLELPENLNELYELTKQFAFKDPNGNGIEDEHGMDYDSRRGSTPFLDIFLANGCYLSNNGQSSFAFDYSTNTFEDAMLKPGMKESLDFIKALYAEGLLHANENWDFAKSNLAGNFMSLSLNTDYRVIDINDWYEVYTLSKNEISIMGLRPYKMFVVTANCENPKNTINEFVNIFLADIYGMAHGNYGVEGQSFSFDDNVLKCLYGEDGSDLGRFVAENISLTHFNFNLLIKEEVTLIDPQWTDISIPGAIRETMLYNQFYEEGKLFFDSDFMYNGAKIGINRQFGTSFGSFMNSIENVSVDEFIKNYIAQAKVRGFDEALDFQNTEIGKTAIYRYE